MNTTYIELDKKIMGLSAGELTILSMPKNDNKYQKGYYKVTVKYSLDRDIQHQFINTSTLRVS